MALNSKNMREVTRFVKKHMKADRVLIVVTDSSMGDDESNTMMASDGYGPKALAEVLHKISVASKNRPHGDEIENDDE